MSKPWQRNPSKPDKRLRGRRAVERRLRWLREHPLCEHCLPKGRTSTGAIVDHVIPLSKGGPDDESNFQTLCADCDKVKTADDLGRTLKRTIGPDGFPVA